MATRREELVSVAARLFAERGYEGASMADLADAESTVNATALNPTGVLRVTASLSFSIHHIAPEVFGGYDETPEFMAEQIELAHESTDRCMDLYTAAVRSMGITPARRYQSQ